MDDGTYTGSIEGIKKLKADTQATNYVQGHYKFGPKQADIYLEFLETLYGSVVEFQKQGVGASDMKDKVLPKLKKFRDWKGFDGVIGRYIALAYTEAEANNF
jgi:hypothetical protein